MKISEGVLREIGNVAVEMTRLRQNECKHLAVENVGPETFENLLLAYWRAQMKASPAYVIDADTQIDITGIEPE